LDDVTDALARVQVLFFQLVDVTDALARD